MDKMTGYNLNEIDKPRFVHYFDQIELLRELKPKSVLIIGMGDYVLYDYLKRLGTRIRTLDNDANLKPDYCCDVRDSEALQAIEEHFDVVVACEILEHIQFKQVSGVLKSLSKLGRRIVVSVPYMYLRMFGKDGRLKIAKDLYLISDNGWLKTKIPYFFWIPRRYPDDDYENHKWAVGFLGYSRKRLRETILQDCWILREKVYYPTNAIFYILEGK
ncbi:MAG: hypothetical protein NTY03_04295 [Candidatus Bathyarchaeota archaeon]|nr:hypothetical protein [Candidatus Bathyarchaeota archaeon]